MALVRVRWVVDESGIGRAVRETQDGYQQVAAEQRRVRTEAAELNRLVRNGAREAESATQRWERQQQVLNQALKDGAINQTEFENATAALNSEMEELGDNAFTIEGALDGMIGSIGRLAAAGAIIQQVTEHFRELAEEVSRIADESVAAVDAIGELQQISATPAQLAQRRELERQFQLTGALSQAQAGRAAFTFASGGIEAEPFLKLLENAVVAGQGIGQFAESIELLRSSSESLGSTTDTLSKTFAAADQTFANATEVAIAAGLVAPTAQPLGLRGEEILAAVATARRGLPTIERAQTRTSAILREAAREGIEGATVPEVIANIRKFQEESGKRLDELFGAEAVEGFRVLERRLDEFSQILANIDAAVAGQVFQRRLTVGAEDPELQAAIARRRTDAEIEISLRNEATIRNLAESLVTRRRQIEQEAGVPELKRAIDDFGADVFDTLLGPDPRRHLFKTGPFDDQLAQIERLNENNEKLQELIDLYRRDLARLRELEERERNGPALPAPAGS